MAVNHRVVFVAVVGARLLAASGTAFNTNTGRPELWLFELLTKPSSTITANVMVTNAHKHSIFTSHCTV